MRKLTDEGQIHAKVSRRRIYKIHPAPEDPLVPVRDLGHLQPCLMPVADLKVGPLPEIVADRPVNGGSEIPASRVQAAEKNFFRYREMVEIYEFRDRRERGYPVTTWGTSWPEILGSRSLASQRSSGDVSGIKRRW